MYLDPRLTQNFGMTCPKNNYVTVSYLRVQKIFQKILNPDPRVQKTWRETLFLTFGEETVADGLTQVNVFSNRTWVALALITQHDIS